MATILFPIPSQMDPRDEDGFLLRVARKHLNLDTLDWGDTVIDNKVYRTEIIKGKRPKLSVSLTETVREPGMVYGHYTRQLKAQVLTIVGDRNLWMEDDMGGPSEDGEEAQDGEVEVEEEVVVNFSDGQTCTQNIRRRGQK